MTHPFVGGHVYAASFNMYICLYVYPIICLPVGVFVFCKFTAKFLRFTLLHVVHSYCYCCCCSKCNATTTCLLFIAFVSSLLFAHFCTTHFSKSMTKSFNISFSCGRSPRADCDFVGIKTLMQ